MNVFVSRMQRRHLVSGFRQSILGVSTTLKGAQTQCWDHSWGYRGSQAGSQIVLEWLPNTDGRWNAETDTHCYEIRELEVEN